MPELIYDENLYKPYIINYLSVVNLVATYHHEHWGSPSHSRRAETIQVDQVLPPLLS